MQLTTIAETGERFSDFGPYVASVNDAGTVAFQATLRAGGTGVFTGDGGPVVTAAMGEFVSHPDIDRGGRLCVYGSVGVFLVDGGQATSLVDGFARIGPLGPTMNDGGVVAFRADTRDGRSGVFTVDGGGGVTTIADTARVAAFHGLPVINGRGTVVFRADDGLYAWRDGMIEPVVQDGGRFGRLGRFPSLNAHDTVAFSADSGIFTIDRGARTTLVADGFESYRGALIDDAGRVIFYATPHGGVLGIHVAGGGPAILSIGEALFGSTVAEFALNPVSLNSRGQLAIRLRLADDRQLIVRVG